MDLIQGHICKFVLNIVALEFTYVYGICTYVLHIHLHCYSYMYIVVIKLHDQAT